MPSLKMAAAPTRRALTEDGRGPRLTPPYLSPALTQDGGGRAGVAAGRGGRKRRREAQVEAAPPVVPGPVRPVPAPWTVTRPTGTRWARRPSTGEGRRGTARYRGWAQYRPEAAPPHPWGRPGGPGGGRVGTGAGHGAARGFSGLVMGLGAGWGVPGLVGGSQGGRGSWG